MNDTNTQTARWRRRPEERTPEILAAALECFAKGGFAGTRMDDVAAAAGVTKGTLYLYFPNKQALFEAVVRGAMLPVLDMAQEHIAQSRASASELLEWMLQRWQETSLPAQCAITKIIIAEAGSFPDLARFYLDEVVTRGMRMVRSIIQLGIARGEFRAVDIENATRSVVWPMLMASLWTQSLGIYAEQIDLSAFRKSHYDMLLRGLLDDGAAKRTSHE
ncbi:MAG TPA: TetR/AcrR family transcriptional regulator [Stellaceae bacterium]|jgi:AcrR family transcriptional regulator|nr:TetR/AcrR family transcriptional regulator [Stellaceae bacterium]